MTPQNHPISEEQRAMKLLELKADIALTFGIIEELRPQTSTDFMDTLLPLVFNTILQEVRHLRQPDNLFGYVVIDEPPKETP